MPLALAHWHKNVALTRAPVNLRVWLTLSTSLTVRLQERCHLFAVQRLHQHRAKALRDECDRLSLDRCRQVHEREVLLCCDDMPVVFAHTCVPRTATHADWPGFHRLGSRSLGSLLFEDPRVTRSTLQFACLPSQHPLLQRICTAIPPEQIKSRLFARRCLFQRNRSKMLVTEVFLPGIVHLNCLK